MEISNDNYENETNKIIFNEEKVNLEKNQAIIDKKIENLEEKITIKDIELNDYPSNDYDYWHEKVNIIRSRSSLYADKSNYINMKLNPYFGHIFLNGMYKSNTDFLLVRKCCMIKMVKL